MTTEKTRPKFKLTGTDGSAFAVIGKVRRSLEVAGMKDEAGGFVRRAFAAESYDALLRLAMEFVEID